METETGDPRAYAKEHGLPNMKFSYRKPDGQVVWAYMTYHRPGQIFHRINHEVLFDVEDEFTGVEWVRMPNFII